MNESEALNILKKVGAVLDGHFVYKSRKHGRQYVNKDTVLAYLLEMEILARALAEKFAVHRPEVVIGPTVAGAILAHEVARNLVYVSAEPLAVYAEKMGS